ncbi:sortase [Patescibacteria group bacterium]|nr:sortase [Patescibacteria group bacterium]MCL5797916.1 sortase [Patescibacteria group bacterium]
MSSTIRKVKGRNKRSEITLKRILKNEKKKIRLYLLAGGILFIGLGFYLSGTPASSNSSANNTVDNQTVSQNGEVSSFSQEPVKVDKSLLSVQTKKSQYTPLRIVIPSVDIDLAVKEAKVVNGYWEVFPSGAGWGEGSGYPGEKGNQVIFAHARQGMFLPLKNVKDGEDVYVFTSDKWYQYKIDNIQEVLPSQTEVIAPTKDEVLTLYTCTGFADSKRLIVTAKRV